ncbi:acyltransferase family protein [Microvirga pakistanensis]|uniref:acyltransferase family protein n=1 Tax=Microvirga pakistanensis TaxID=1682650 RepID=UPI00106B77CB|nr:acyltransferase family protein [Microvirga pakistanensis]
MLIREHTSFSKSYRSLYRPAMKINYRPEIDGLRAIAVVPVILFHAGFSWFSGGFVGVDVFFVISGFLITSIVLADLEASRFSIRTFYERRARRILPALFVVVAACVPAAWLLLPYSQLVEFGQSVLSVSAFVSNIHFWLNTGYFETESELKPLLHTWSLAVEEQYYIISPILLWFLWTRAKGAIVPLLSILAVASIILAEHGSQVAPEAAFFLPHTRIWELALGTLAAVLVMQNGGVRQNGVLSLIGLAMIATAIFLYDEATPFPGVYALLPTVGAVLVLTFTGPGTAAHRLLSMKPLVGIGLVSYSAYLWHQPLFAFARHLSISEPAPYVMFALSGITMILAYLSWRFVEQPFRRSNAISRHAIFSLSGAGLVTSAALGVFIAHSELSRTRITLGGESFVALSKETSPNLGLSGACRQFTTVEKCASGPNPIAVLWGDSYAMHLAQALRDSPTTLPFAQMTKSACAPILGVAYNGPRYNTKWGMDCIKHNEQVLEWLKGQPHIRYVILSSPFGLIGGMSQLTLATGDVIKSGDLSETHFIETIKRIKNLRKSVVIVSPTPAAEFNVGRCLVIQSILGRTPDNCHFPLEGHGRAGLYKKLADISARTGAGLVLLSDLICEGGLCLSSQNGTMIFRDGGHLSPKGSSLLGRSKDLSKRIIAAAGAEGI